MSQFFSFFGRNLASFAPIAGAVVLSDHLTDALMKSRLMKHLVPKYTYLPICVRLTSLSALLAAKECVQLLFVVQSLNAFVFSTNILSGDPLQGSFDSFDEDVEVDDVSEETSPKFEKEFSFSEFFACWFT